MRETYLSLGQKTLYCRHTTIREGRLSILLIHGLGESGLSFVEIFVDQRFDDAFNIVVPDLFGYGRSSRLATGNYTFEHHLADLQQVIAFFGLRHIIVVGHSLGGDLGTLLCQRQCSRRIERFVNVEGNLTEDDLFISERACQAEKDGRFDSWFYQDFLDGQVYGAWCPRWPFARRYLASLHFCDPLAFLQNATELFRRNRANGSQSSGAVYRGLPLPKLFVFGQKSLAPASQRFLQRYDLAALEVRESHHWPMVECPSEFYGVLNRWCRGEMDNEYG